MNGSVHGRTAIVTGAASGIGSATARLLLQEGANVIATDIDEARGRAAILALDPALQERSVFVHHDVTDEDAWAHVLDLAEGTFGPLDILVNNAGVLPALVPLESTSLEDWRRVMAVNLDGVFLGVKHGFRRMKAHGGAIVNVSSVAGMVGMPLTGAYCPSKGGVLLLTKAAALEGAKYERPVRVNAVHPGYIQTEMTSSIADILGGDRFERRVQQVVPMKTLGSADQVAEAIVFLASDKAKFMTGSSMVIDGGWTAQ